MARRKEQYRKQQIATVGHSDKSSRRMNRLAKRIKEVSDLSEVTDEKD